MINKETILNALPKFENKYFCLAETQSVKDIMSGIKTAHIEFAPDYDNIAGYFIRPTTEQTAKAIFDFLKNNTVYEMESDRQQTVKSPGAILETNKIDCKHLSLFAGGILDAINRLGEMKIPYVYRFVSDNIMSTDPTHVFVVVNPGTNKELFIDPIPQVKNFNNRINYYYSTDKKYKTMLYKVSGAMNGFADDALNFTNKSTKAVTKAGTDIAADIDALKSVFNLFSNLFSNRPNPNDWQGWDAQDRKNGQWDGSSTRGWVLNDGDSVSNEAVNIASYIKAYGLKRLTSSGHPTTVQGTGWRDVTIAEIADKFRRGGLFDEAKGLEEIQSKFEKAGGETALTAYGNPPNTGTIKANTNMYLTFGLIGAALFFLLKKPK